MTRPVGALIHAAQLAGALAADGVDVRRIAVVDAVDGYVDRDPHVMRLAAVDEAGLGDPTQLAEAVAASMPRVIEVGHAEDPVAAAALFSLRDAGLVRSVAVSVHHLEVSAELDAEQRITESLRGADVVICASQWWAERIEREFNVTPRVVPHGVDVARFAEVAEDRAAAGAAFGWGDRPVVLAMGGVQPRKGSRVLLEAFARARARIGTGALLVIAGVGDRSEFHAEWREDAERLGVRIGTAPAEVDVADVLELGVVDNADMPLLYRASDVLVTPSTREGFGLVALEAAASGVPNVMSDLPVFAEHFTDEATCLMAVAGDSGSLAVAIVRAMRETPLRERLVAAAGTMVAGLSWTACAAQHAAIYRELAVPAAG
jgi:glycosyltransferase involved in cell wall biosynthesis